MENLQESPDVFPKTPAQNKRSVSEGMKGNKRLFSDLELDYAHEAAGTALAEHATIDTSGPQSDKRPRAENWPLQSNRVIVEADTAQTRNILLHSSAWDEPLNMPKAQPRSSRFVEGSMSNRQSQRPPTAYLGETPTKYEQDNLKSPRTPFFRSIKKAKRPLPKPPQPNLGPQIESAVDTERSSTMFRFGKSLAATFNPSKWKIWNKNQTEERADVSEKPTDAQRQAEFEAAYQAVKAKGYIYGNRPGQLASPHKVSTQAEIETRYGRPFPETPTVAANRFYSEVPAKRPTVLDPEAFDKPPQSGAHQEDLPQTPEYDRPTFTTKELESHKKLFGKVTELEMKLSLARQDLAEALNTPAARKARTTGRHTEGSSNVPPLPSGLPNASNETICTDESTPTRIKNAFSENQTTEPSQLFTGIYGDHARTTLTGSSDGGLSYGQALEAAARKKISNARKDTTRNETTTDPSRKSSMEGKVGTKAPSTANNSSSETIMTTGPASGKLSRAKKSTIEIFKDPVLANAMILESNAESFEKARKVSKKKSESALQKSTESSGTEGHSHDVEGEKWEERVKQRAPSETSTKSTRSRSRIPRKREGVSPSKATIKKDQKVAGFPSAEVSQAESTKLRRSKSSRSLRSDNKILAAQVAGELLALPTLNVEKTDQKEPGRRKSVADLKENANSRTLKKPAVYDNSRPLTAKKASTSDARSRSKDRLKEMTPTKDKFEWGPDVF